MKKKTILTSLLLSLCLTPSFAQFQDSSVKEDTPKWYFGFGGGFHSNFMKYSDLDDKMYPDQKNINSGVYSIFIQRDFGSQNQWSLRPEISFLKRGGKLTNIGSKYFDYEEGGIKDISYQLSARYWDIRIPVIYNFGKLSSSLRPYIYVAPVFGFPMKGDIQIESEDTEGYYDGYTLSLSDANMAQYYIAAAAGIGIKYQFKNACFLALEGSYEYGFTDTYGKKEKDGEAIIESGLMNNVYDLKGNRKFSGFEIKATLGIPFSIFKKKEAPKPEPIVVAQPIVAPAPVQPKEEPKKEKPCYTLEEIIDMMNQNESVLGKTICAIDAVNFDFGKSTIQKESYEYLNKLAETLIKTNAKIKVKGHTDNVGSKDFNLKLSKERAESVVNYLISRGVGKNKLSYSYYGMSQPLTTNDTEEGRTINRRVEFEILK